MYSMVAFPKDKIVLSCVTGLTEIEIIFPSD